MEFKFIHRIGVFTQNAAICHCRISWFAAMSSKMLKVGHPQLFDNKECNTVIANRLGNHQLRIINNCFREILLQGEAQTATEYPSKGRTSGQYNIRTCFADTKWQIGREGHQKSTLIWSNRRSLGPWRKNYQPSRAIFRDFLSWPEVELY